MDPQITQLFQLLKSERFIFSNEKFVQQEIEKLLLKSGLPFRREFIFNEESTIDFLMDSGIGIEVKIKGNKRAIYRQMERYAELEQVKQLILVTSISTGLPADFNGKPVYIFNISRAWM